LLARKPDLVSQFGPRRGIGETKLVFPDRRIGPSQQWIGIVAGLDRRDHRLLHCGDLSTQRFRQSK
jgi:hypothetical protein